MINKKELFDASKYEPSSDVSEIEEALEYEQILLSISKSIMQYRKDNNLTQSELANMLGVKQEMISKLERGNYNPTIKMLHHFSRKLTKSFNLYVNILRDMISSLYKGKNIFYRSIYTEYEIIDYNCNKKEDNITYLYVNSKEKNKNYGGMIYGKVNTTNGFSIGW